MLNLLEVIARPVYVHEEKLFQNLMQEHHYLGALPKISETIWYIALWKHQWLALLTFSASALKCTARDQWIGWDIRHQYDRLKLVTNNSRFLILPGYHYPNLASRVLSLCQKRICSDWQSTFGHDVLLLETFVDPQKFQGTIYKATNWQYVGKTKGFGRTREGYTKHSSFKMVFVKPLKSNARALLSNPILKPAYRIGNPRIMLNADSMRSLPAFFSEIPDPRRAQGIRHRLPTVLAIATGAILCGMRGYQAISDWAISLSQRSRERFACRRENGKYVVPSMFVIRDILIRVDPVHLDRALQAWNEAYGEKDKTLAIDGKTMRNAIENDGRQVHIMSAVGHQSKNCYTQKKSALYP